MQETQVWSQGREDPLEKDIATHFSILAWEIPPRNALVEFLGILFWASLRAQLVKDPPAMQKIPVRFLGGEEPMEKG